MQECLPTPSPSTTEMQQVETDDRVSPTSRPPRVREWFLKAKIRFFGTILFKKIDRW